MPISSTAATLKLSGVEPPMANIVIDGKEVDFESYDGTLSSVTVDSGYSISLSGFDNQDEAFYGMQTTANLNVSNNLPDGEYLLKIIDSETGNSLNYNIDVVNGKGDVVVDLEEGVAFQGMLINSELTHSAGVKGVTV